MPSRWIACWPAHCRHSVPVIDKPTTNDWPALFSLSSDIYISLGKFHQADLSNKKMERVFAPRRLAWKLWISPHKLSPLHICDAFFGPLPTFSIIKTARVSARRRVESLLESTWYANVTAWGFVYWSAGSFIKLRNFIRSNSLAINSPGQQVDKLFLMLVL